jgi:hypothetical protein
MNVRLGGSSLFERKIWSVNWLLLGQLLTSPAGGCSSFAYKKPQLMIAAVFTVVKNSSNQRISLYDTIRGLS